MNPIQITAILIGLVALARRAIPSINGARVVIAAIALGILVAVIEAPCELVADAGRGVVSGLTAFGVMTAIHYATRRFAASQSDPTATPVDPTTIPDAEG